MARASRFSFPFFSQWTARAGSRPVPSPSRYISPRNPIASTSPAWAARWKRGKAAWKFPASYRLFAAPTSAVAAAFAGVGGAEEGGPTTSGRSAAPAVVPASTPAGCPAAGTGASASLGQRSPCALDSLSGPTGDRSTLRGRSTPAPAGPGAALWPPAAGASVRASDRGAPYLDQTIPEPSATATASTTAQRGARAASAGRTPPPP